MSVPIQVPKGSPVIDIVVPVYNGSSYLVETLKSIEGQSYPFINIYAVDDHSTDSTPDILASHISRFPFTIIRHPVNRGLSAARNSGIAAGAGKYVAILDADDLWLPAKLEHQVGLIEESDLKLGVVSCDFQITDECGNCNDPMVYDDCCDLDPSTRDRLVFGNVVSGGSAALIRRECFEQCGGFDEALSACEDWEMWYRIAGHYPIRILREPLVLVRVHSKSMQGDTPRMLRNRIEVLRRFAQDPQSHRVAASCLFNECVVAFRYLSPPSSSSFDQAMLQLQGKGIDSGSVSPFVWRLAYRHYRRTYLFFSCWRFLDDRFRIYQRLSRSPQVRWLYRRLRRRIRFG
jgi:glycosyltransferase involved in cell wall biosynthesis